MQLLGQLCVRLPVGFVQSALCRTSWQLRGNTLWCALGALGDFAQQFWYSFAVRLEHLFAVLGSSVALLCIIALGSSLCGYWSALSTASWYLFVGQLGRFFAASWAALSTGTRRLCVQLCSNPFRGSLGGCVQHFWYYLTPRLERLLQPWATLWPFFALRLCGRSFLGAATGWLCVQLRGAALGSFTTRSGALGSFTQLVVQL